MLLVQGIDIERAVLEFWVGFAAAERQPSSCGCARSS